MGKKIRNFDRLISIMQGLSTEKLEVSTHITEVLTEAGIQGQDAIDFLTQMSFCIHLGMQAALAGEIRDPNDIDDDISDSLDRLNGADDE